VARRGEQKTLGSALDSVLRALDRKSRGGYTTAKVVLAWHKVATGILSAHTTGTHLRDGELVVYVDGNSWATHFSAEAERYRVAVNQELGQELVQSVRFIVSKRVAEERKQKEEEGEVADFYAADKVVPIPLTETETRQIEASVARIPDEELREAVYRATVKDLQWKKGLAAENGPQTASGGS